MDARQSCHSGVIVKATALGGGTNTWRPHDSDTDGMRTHVSAGAWAAFRVVIAATDRVEGAVLAPTRQRQQILRREHRHTWP